MNNILRKHMNKKQLTVVMFCNQLRTVLINDWKHEYARRLINPMVMKCIDYTVDTLETKLMRKNLKTIKSYLELLDTYKKEPTHLNKMSLLKVFSTLNFGAN